MVDNVYNARLCHPERSEGSQNMQHIINRHPEEGIINEQLAISN